jgi:hypothetical protein
MRLVAGDTIASATLISPSLALTSNHVVGTATTVELSLPHASPEAFTGTVEERDAERDFATIRLTEPVTMDLGNPVFTAAVPAPDAAWHAAGAAPDADRSGWVVGPARIDGREYLRLRQGTGPTSEAGSTGAPVLVDGQIVGMLALQQEADWYAITVASMAASARISAVADLLPLDKDLFLRQLSPSSRRALTLAAQFATETGQQTVHMEHLVLALYAKKDGPADHLIKEAGLGEAGLRAALKQSVEATLPPLPSDFTSIERATALPQTSGHVGEAFRAARNIARTTHSTGVQSRHLLYGVLSVEQCDVTKKLLEAGVRKERIDLTDRAAQARAAAIAGYQSDAVGGPDLLGIEDEVESLCMVLAAKDVQPPLSLGLFGDWGSGKSFFMSEMEKWFNRLLESEENKSPASPYCSRMVQLKFNAWHYSDTNLWATLASAIMQGLAEALAGKEDPDSHYARASLETQKVAERDKLDGAEQRLNAIQSEVQATDARLERLSEPPSAWAVFRESVLAAENQPELKRRLDAASASLGIPAARAASAEVQAQLLEVKSFTDALAMLLRTGGTRRLAALAVAAIAFVLVGTWLMYYVKQQGFDAWVLSGTTVLVAAAEGLRRLIAPMRAALGVVEQVRDDARVRLERETRELEKAREELRLAAGAERRIAEEARSNIAKLDAQLDELRPDRQVVSFIRQRSQSTDYIAQLGTISHARRDFEQLTTLLDQVRTLASKPGQTELLLPRIDRIILYIDDLDRCPEEKVVHVLQAVHLLLAFKLFVVVVGVDPRWLLHSLTRHSSAFQNGEGQANGSERTEERAHWRSTPLSYLEKIFQIPFTLRPMARTGFGKMVDQLTIAPANADTQKPPVEKKESDSQRPLVPSGGGGSKPAAGSPGAVASTSAGGTRPSTAAGAAGSAATRGTPAQEPVATSAPRRSGAATRKPIPMSPEPLSIKPFERECMKKLHDLIPSPRAAKRYVNVYRLIRTSVSDKQWEHFIGDEKAGAYRPVLVLLAMLTGYPAETTEFLRAVIEDRLPDGSPLANRTFWGLVDEFSDGLPQSAGPEVGNTAQDGERWSELARKLQAVRALVPEDCLCKAIRPYARGVARYSFQSGRILLASDETEEKTVDEETSANT